MNRINPFASAVSFARCIVTGRLRFPRARVGEVFVSDDERAFRIFREAQREPESGQPRSPGARFIVRFRLARMSPRLNRVFSLLPIPFVVGLPGFRSKLWMLDERSGEFQGVYEWQTVADAQNYAASFAMRFMKRRAEPGSVVHQVSELGTESGS